ncbi:hypothetical protein [Vulcanococcus limneticus]|uniref:hypothetical protein n=1 Tax=Vulcanococcus limneticus TaxID=2170428 RepID=UPI00398BC82D
MLVDFWDRGRSGAVPSGSPPSQPSTLDQATLPSPRATETAPRRRPPWRRKRWLSLGIPAGTLAVLVAIAPPLPEKRLLADATPLASGEDVFRYATDDAVFALDFDPRKVRLDLLEGWDREADAYADSAALAYVSGPMYERHVNNSGQEITVPLGDIKLGERVWRGRNRTAARQRAFVGIRHDGRVDFGYGELTPERAVRYDSFIGGLHSLYNDLESPPSEYRGAYSISVGQQIRYYLPRIRMVIGLRGDGRLEVLMSREGLTLEQTRALARERGLRAAYLPDHASKSRLIVPGVKDFSEADANWISGGATSFVHVPYLLRLSRRSVPLQGDLLASLTPRLGARNCGNPLQCGQTLGGQLLDRALAGFNRLMEEGIQPVARLIWAPLGPKDPQRLGVRAPLREPPITADPMALRELQNQGEDRSPVEAPLAPDLPPPLLLQEGQSLPQDPEAVTPEPGPGAQPGSSEVAPEPPGAGQAPAPDSASGAPGTPAGAPLKPPAPLLPPPLLPTPRLPPPPLPAPQLTATPPVAPQRAVAR